MAYNGYPSTGYGGYPSVDRYGEKGYGHRSDRYDKYETRSVDRLGERRDRAYGRETYSEKGAYPSYTSSQAPGYYGGGGPLSALPPQPSGQYAVTSQPMSMAGMDSRGPKRDWNSDLCACTNDMKVCMCVLFCSPFYECYKMSEFDEHCCNAWPCCLGTYGSVMMLRYRMRATEQIQGSMMEDCLMTTLCTPCVTCQLIRENDYIKKDRFKTNRSLGARMESRAAEAYGSRY